MWLEFRFRKSQSNGEEGDVLKCALVKRKGYLGQEMFCQTIEFKGYVHYFNIKSLSNCNNMRNNLQ